MKLDYVYMGKQIQYHRRCKGMSRGALADALGITAAHVGHIERGTRHVSLETLVAISRQLNVSLDALVFPDAAEEPNLRTRLSSVRALLEKAEELIDDLPVTVAD